MSKHYVNPSGHLVELDTPPMVKAEVVDDDGNRSKQWRLKEGWREATAEDLEHATESERRRAEREARDTKPGAAPGGPLKG